MFKKNIEKLNKLIGDLNSFINNHIQEIKSYQEDIINEVESIKESFIFSDFDKEELKAFFNEPYVIIPSKKNDEWFVVVPKFIKLNLGWLEFSTNSFNVFKVNRFINWLGDIPSKLKKKFRFEKPLPFKVFDGYLFTGQEYQEIAFKKYRAFLSKREGKDKIKIKKGSTFKLIASLIDDGIMPFMMSPVENSDIRDFTFNLEDWQQEIWNRIYVQKAWKTFKEWGCIGIYWAFSAGKSVFGSLVCDKIKGLKLVVVPTLMLAEQWQARLSKMGILDEVKIITYSSYHKIKNKKFVLTIFDECHRLPANTYSKLSLINTKYRIGLSATPYREDGRTDYIFALTGYPVGMDWSELLSEGFIKKPTITLFIANTLKNKIAKLEELIRIPKKTIIFCDSIKLGKKISNKFKIPFIYGLSKDRLNIIKKSDICVVSRVGDEGVSLPDIERVIEIDFLFGSRRQEGQRMGRLFHGSKNGEHYIIMTEEELKKYEKRLYAIYEKGFKIKTIRL